MAIKIIMLVIFFGVMIGVGVYCRRHATDVNGFVLGGRNVGPWLTAFAYGTSYFSAVIFIGYAGQFGWKFTSMRQYEYRGEGTLKLWLSRVTANEALGFLRRKGSITFTDNIPDSLTDDEPDISQISDEALSEMIASLPEGYRVVLNLYVFGQMSHKEIADELGITPSTSASQYYHAKKMLANKIKEYNKRLEI